MYAPFNALAAAVWMYLPAFAANAAPVLVALLPIPRRPIWPSLLGANKTWNGLVGGVLVGVLAGLAQLTLTPWHRVVDAGPWIAWSALVSFGALFADAAKSVLKRKIGIPPGGALPVVDGIDYVVGAMVFGLAYFVPSWQIALALLVAGPVLSLLANVASYLLGWKKVWY